MATRDEVYRKFGITAEAAQLFETALGTALWAVQGLQNGWHLVPKPKQARAALDRVNESTLGTLLKRIQQYVELEGNLPAIFFSALKTRNRLMHEFYERHNFKIETDKGCDDIIADLEAMHNELFMAWQRADQIAAILCSKVENDQSKNEATKH